MTNLAVASGSVVFALALSASSSAGQIEVTYDMSGTSVVDGSYVYGQVSNWTDYAGSTIIGIGARDLVVDFTATTNIQFAWAMDLTNAGYGAGIFIFAVDGPHNALSQTAFNFVFDISAYEAQVLPNEYYGSWNMGGFLGSGGTDNAMTVVSGEMYYIVDYSAVPGSGAAMLICAAGIRRRRRR